MDKISINLLPPELAQAAKVKAKQSRISAISVIGLLAVIGITAATLSLSLIEKRSEDKARGDLTSARQRIDSLRPQQTALFQLKNRLDLIDNLTKNDTPQVKALQLIVSLTPQNVLLDSFSVDKKGNISLGVKSPDATAFQTLLDALTSQDKIGKVSLDSLALKGDLVYKGQLTVTLK